MQKIVAIPDDWYLHLRDTLESSYFKGLGGFIASERKTKSILPHKDEVFKAFNLTPFQKVRVVILGDDLVPPSLEIIYRKIKEDIYPGELSFPIDMDLEAWAKQGILLINAALTIEEGKSGSHMTHWNQFTEAVFKTLNDNTTGLIFCFWGKDALKFAPLIDDKFHHILVAPHPAAALYAGGKWGCDHFKRINEILMANNGDQIDWLQNLK